jgi:hypothetical protein
MTTEGIQSLGPPPQRHADRVVAAMLRDLARKHVTVGNAIVEAIGNSSDGSPKAQAKMAERIRRAGARHVQLYPGKRGRYEVIIHDFTGWDPSREAEICPDDPIPEKPWIACYVTSFKSTGGGRHHFDLKSRPLLFISHHAMSRAAQRLDMRTSADLMADATAIWNSAVKLLNEKGLDAALQPPPAGWRVPLVHINPPAFVVLQRHRDDKRNALVAATVIG